MKTAALSGIGKIRHRSPGAHQNQLPKFLKLFYCWFEDILDAIDLWQSRAAFKAGDGIRSQQFGSGCGCNPPRGSQAFPVKCVSGEQDGSSTVRTEKGSGKFDSLCVWQGRFRQCRDYGDRTAVAPSNIGRDD